MTKATMTMNDRNLPFWVRFGFASAARGETPESYPYWNELSETERAQVWQGYQSYKG